MNKIVVLFVVCSATLLGQTPFPSPGGPSTGGGGGGGGTIPSVVTVLNGDGAGGAADSGITSTTIVTSAVEETNIGGTRTGNVLTFRFLGTLAAARLVNAGVHTGDSTSTFPAITINAGAITLAKMANLAANSIICNNTGSGAVPLACTVSQVKTLLALACSDLSNAVSTCSSLASPAFTGVPTAPTPATSSNDTTIPTTAFIATAIANAIAASNPAIAVLAASTTNVAGTYANGVSGIGATFTVTATGAFTLDGISINAVGQRVLLKDQTSALQNGMYTATVVGTTGVSPVFTRALDYDAPSDINYTAAIQAQSGTVNALTSWLLTTQVTTVGTDPLTYSRYTVNPANEVLNNAANTGTSAMTLDMSASSGANALKVPVAAGATAGADGVVVYDSTGKITHYRTNGADSKAVASTTTSTTITHVVHATAVAGIYEPSAIVLGDLPAGPKLITFGASFNGGGSALTTGTSYLTIPVACTINAWNILVDAGTATFSVWRLATGTAIPTVSNTINTSGVSISSGTAVRSTTVSDFTSTAISANDIIAIRLGTVATATQAFFSVECAQ